eukprot:XP_001710278.1 Hypothetical protein GL50803_38761 [Giardia lamblia ATCC 50803]
MGASTGEWEKLSFAEELLSTVLTAPSSVKLDTSEAVVLEGFDRVFT